MRCRHATSTCCCHYRIAFMLAQGSSGGTALCIEQVFARGKTCQYGRGHVQVIRLSHWFKFWARRCPPRCARRDELSSGAEWVGKEQTHLNRRIATVEDAGGGAWFSSAQVRVRQKDARDSDARRSHLILCRVQFPPMCHTYHYPESELSTCNTQQPRHR